MAPDRIKITRQRTMTTPTICAALDTFQQAANRGTAVYLSPELVQELRDALGTESDAEALAARPLLEEVAAMADCIGAQTVGQITAISNRAATLLQQLAALRRVPVVVEALTRLYWWGGMSGAYGYSADVVLGVRDWINSGMVGGLPPLPAWIADRCPPLPAPQAREGEA